MSFGHLRRPRLLLRAAALTLATLVAVVSAAACDSASSPTGPTPIDQFAGRWTASTAGELPASCTELDYEITPGTDGRSASVRFEGTCADITASGTGSGTVSGDTLLWSAQGTASGRGLTCPFSFTDSKATRDGDRLRLEYSGTICGVAVQGSELLRRR